MKRRGWSERARQRGGVGGVSPQGRDQYHGPVKIHPTPQVPVIIEGGSASCTPAEPKASTPGSEPGEPEIGGVLPSRQIPDLFFLTEEDRAATDARAERLALRARGVARERCKATRQEIEWALSELAGETMPRSVSDAVELVRAARRRQHTKWRRDQGVGLHVPKGEITVLAQGVDSLYVSIHTTGALLQQAQDALEDAKRRSEAGESVRVGWGDMRWDVAPHGAAPHYRWIMRGPACTIKIRKRYAEGQPLAYVEVRSAWLWQDGPDLVVDTLRALFARWVGGKVQASVSRIDLAVDFQGWEPTGAENLPRHLVNEALVTGAWVSRSTRRAVYVEATKAPAPLLGEKGNTEGKEVKRRWIGEKDAEHRWGALWWRGQRLTGVQHGSGSIVARIYNKTREIQVHGGAWREGIWEQCPGYNPKLTVTRLEFQIRREALNNIISTGKRKIHPSTDRELPALSATALWFHVRGCIGGLWRYLTGGGGTKGWLTLRAPNGDSNRSRWGVHKVWEVLAGVRWKLGDGAKIKRLWPVSDKTATSRIKLKEYSHRSYLDTDAGQLKLGETPITANPERFLNDDGTVDLEQVAACLGTGTLAWYGNGPKNGNDLHPGAGIEHAADRVKRLQPQAVGTLATWAASVIIEEGAEIPPDPAGLAELLALFMSRKGILKAVAEKVPIAMDRTTVRSAIRYDLGAGVTAFAAAT